MGLRKVEEMGLERRVSIMLITQVQHIFCLEASLMTLGIMSPQLGDHLFDNKHFIF